MPYNLQIKKKRPDWFCKNLSGHKITNLKNKDMKYFLICIGFFTAILLTEAGVEEQNQLATHAGIIFTIICMLLFLIESRQLAKK